MTELEKLQLQLKREMDRRNLLAAKANIRCANNLRRRTNIIKRMNGAERRIAELEAQITELQNRNSQPRALRDRGRVKAGDSPETERRHLLSMKVNLRCQKREKYLKCKSNLLKRLNASVGRISKLKRQLTLLKRKEETDRT
jgi:hypothetical protein